MPVAHTSQQNTQIALLVSDKAGTGGSVLKSKGSQLKLFCTEYEKDQEKEFSCTDYESMLSNWHKRVTAAQISHYEQSEYLYRVSQWTGWSLIFSTVFVTSMSFFQYGKDVNGVSKLNLLLFSLNSNNIQFLVIGIGIFSAVLSGIVSQSRFSERAEQHRAAAGRYGNIRRNIESALTKLRVTNGKQEYAIENDIERIRLQWEFISTDAPLSRKKFLFNK